MLSFVQGKIISVDQQSVTVQTGGLGLVLQSPHPEAYQKDKEVKVLVYLHWNQEQGPSLFGFSSELEKAIFLLVISCSGMGPKIGLALLAQLAPVDFLTAVQEGDDKMLSAVSGIGPKKAEQMVVQLRHKVAKLIESGVSDNVQGATKLEHWKNVTQVLQSLSYSRQEIDATIVYLRKEFGGSKSTFDELIRHGLSFLAKRV